MHAFSLLHQFSSLIHTLATRAVAVLFSIYHVHDAVMDFGVGRVSAAVANDAWPDHHPTPIPPAIKW